MPVEYVERQGVEDLAVPVAEDRARLAVHLVGLHRHVDPDEPGEDRGKHPGDIVGAHDRPGQLRGLAAAVRDDLNVSGEQLPQAVDVAFPERAEEPCRQLAVRARRHMDAGRPRFEADRREREELAERFFDAFREGDVNGLRELLAADVQMIGDGGGKAPQFARGIIGAENVARVLAAFVPPSVQLGIVVEPHEVNGQPGAIFRYRDGKVLNTFALDILEGRIQTIRAVINPDKLGHLGPVADAWAVLREANQARRSTD